MTGRTRVVVVADDLTGAADTGSRFAARGYETAIGERPSSAVAVYDTDSRNADPGVAADRVADVVAGSDPEATIYKKIDSTLRGNPVVETEAAVEAAGADLAVVAPAFPAQGRTTVGGIHAVDGTPITERETPGVEPSVPTADLAALFSVSSYPVASVGLETVAAGACAVADALAEVRRTHGRAVVVCDAAEAAHLAAVADGAARLDARVCYVGSGGLAGHVRVERGDAVLGVVGSVTPVTLSQLAALPEETVVKLDAVAALADADAAVSRAASAARDRLAAGNPAVVTAATDPADVNAALAAGRERGLSEAAVRDRVADALGTVARRTIPEAPVRGLLLSGGAVAGAALDGDDVSLTGHEVTEGVPVGRLAGDLAPGLPVVTKAGAFGDDETILTCLDRLARYAHEHE